MANESLLITMLPDGTYHVKETEAPGENDPEPAIDQTVQSPDDVTQLVQQWLSSEADEGEDAPPPGGDGGADEAAEGEPSPGGASNGPSAAAAWNQEAKTRDASGFRK